MNSLKYIISSVVLMALCSFAYGQTATTWTLEQCLNHALQNNISIKQQELNAEYMQNQYVQKNRFGRLPSVNASASYTIGFGRTQIESEYKYIDQTTHNGDARVSADMPLFQGLTLNNTIHKRETEWKAAMEQVAITQNDIALAITTNFLQILFDKELLEIARQQYELTNQQVERARILVDKGSAAASVFYEIKAQGAKEALNVTVQENNLMMSKLNLAQLLDLEEIEGFDIVIPALPESQPLQTEPAANIYGVAVDIMPEIKQASLKVESSRYDVDIAKGSLYPTLSLNGGWRSGVYYTKGMEFDFNSQFRNNSNSYIGLSLQIPIFNGLSARYNVKNANIAFLNSNYELDAQKLALRKKIQQAWADANAAWKKYNSGIEASQSYEESFRQTETRFNVGIANTIEYNTAKNEFMRAQSELLQAKYECILRDKVLDFYKGEKIGF